MNSIEIQISEMSFPDCDEKKRLLEELHLSCPAGKVTAILGPSGAGKTTLLRIIAGLELKYFGSVRINNRTVTAPNPQVQLVFQDYRTVPWRTVRDNLWLPTLRLRLTKRQRENLVDGWLLKASLADLANRWPKSLSGGEEARLAIARALIQSPTVLLLDEPFRNLDLATKSDVLCQLKTLVRSGNTTTVLVSHNPEDAVELADRIALFDTRPMTSPYLVEVPRDKGVVKESTANSILADVTSFSLGQLSAASTKRLRVKERL